MNKYEQHGINYQEAINRFFQDEDLYVSFLKKFPNDPSRLLKLSLCFLDLYLFYKTILADFFGFFYVFSFFVLFFML